MVNQNSLRWSYARCKSINKPKLCGCPSFVPRRIALFAYAAGDDAGVRRLAGEPSFVFNCGSSSFAVRGFFGEFVVVFKRAKSRLLRSLRTVRGSEVRNCGWNGRRVGRMLDILNRSVASRLIQHEDYLENEARKRYALHSGPAEFPVTAEAWRLCLVSTFGVASLHTSDLTGPFDTCHCLSPSNIFSSTDGSSGP